MSKTTNDKIIRIGGASGFWGETPLATQQLLADESLDYIVYDYLAEITMSLMARARAAKPELGYAPDFVTAALKPNLAEIARQGVRIISNAGGVNPHGCAEAVRGLIEAAGLDLTVAVVTGDDLLDRRSDFEAAAPTEMFSGTAFPPTDSLASINAYLGAFPIARALDEGADIVLTWPGGGQCSDPGGLHSRIWLDAERSRSPGGRKPGRTYPGVRSTGHRRQFHRLGAGSGLTGQYWLSDRRTVS